MRCLPDLIGDPHNRAVRERVGALADGADMGGLEAL